MVTVTIYGNNRITVFVHYSVTESRHLSLSHAIKSIFFSQDSGVDPSYGLGELLISLCHNPTDHKLNVKILSARRLQPFPNGRMSEYTMIIFLNSIPKIFSSLIALADCLQL